MFDDPEKRFQRRFIGVDDTDAEKIEMDGAGKMAGCKVFGGAKINQKRSMVRTELPRELVGLYQQRLHIKNYILASREGGNYGGTARRNPAPGHR